MDEDSRQYWIIPITCLILVVGLMILGVDVRANTPDRYIEPPVAILTEKVSSGLSPYVEYCNPDTDFFPTTKVIENSTHIFNHQYCIWEEK